jgi:hypothetical protein
VALFIGFFLCVDMLLTYACGRCINAGRAMSYHCLRGAMTWQHKSCNKSPQRRLDKTLQKRRYMQVTHVFKSQQRRPLRQRPASFHNTQSPALLSTSLATHLASRDPSTSP